MISTTLYSVDNKSKLF